MGGYIIQLQNFSVNDGEGIRTNVFMAGCPLRCAWCANPEGQVMKNPMTRWVETEEILSALRRQLIFYRYSGGGVTFSGGEPTAQPQFLKENETALGQGFYTVETGLYSSFGMRVENDFILSENGAEDLFEELLPLDIKEYILV